MPVHGIDHLEIYAGNAAQAAFFFTRAFGFTETAYAGLETGQRDRVSHVLEQGRIRLVITGTLGGDDEIGDHHRRHGDSVHSIALSVPDARAAYDHAVEHGARGIEVPRTLEDEHGSVVVSSVSHLWRGPPHLHRAQRLRAAPSYRATRPAARPTAARTACSPASTTWWATWSSATWRNGWATTSASSG